MLSEAKHLSRPAIAVSGEKILRFAPFFLFAAVLGLYLSTLAPGLVRSDGGELQYHVATLGTPHPTGYPLYALLGWLWTQAFPLGAIAWRINLISALCGAGAVALVYGVIHRLVGRPLPALAGALFLACSPRFWILSSVTEVYALHALFVALVLYLLLVWRDAGARRPRWLLLVSFAYGLSLSHHRTMVLLAPAMALFVLLETWPAGGERVRLRPGLRSARTCALLIAAFAAGLLPYAEVFYQHLKRGETARHVLLNVILGGDFAGFLGLRSDAVRVAWDLPRHEVGLVGLGLALAGLAWLAWRRRSAAWLLAVAVVTNVVFCLVYNVPDIEDFTLPTTLLLAVLAGASGGWLGSSRLGSPSPPPSPSEGEGVRAPLPLRERGGGEGESVLTHRSTILRALIDLTLLALALFSLRHLPEVRAGVAERDGRVEAQARALLSYPFEPGASVIADWDTTTAVVFLRDVEGAPRDTPILPARMNDAGACDSLRQQLDAGIPVYVAPPVLFTRLPDGFSFVDAYPYLKLVRGAPAYTRLDRPLDPRLTLQGVSRQGRLLVLRWQVTGAPLPEEYTTYVHYFDAAGQPLGQQDKGMGSELSCWFPPTSWPAGQVVQDLYVLPPGTATVRAGLYAWRGDHIEPQGTDTTLTLP